MNPEARLSFISELEIPEFGAYNLLQARLADNPRSGWIDGGSAVSFVAGVSPQSQRDALNSMLLAQLAANAKFDREKDTVNWYGFYKTVLENVGWVLQNFAFSKYNSSSSSFTMDKVVLDLIAAIASGDEIAAVQATLDAMRALGGKDGRIVLFESESTSASQGNFQIAVANETGGLLSVKIGASYFSASESHTGFLWFSYDSSSTSMYRGSQTMTLDKQIYQYVRAQVVQKLGSYAQTFVQDLQIKP